MSYTALYRKFRPSAFEDVKGQDHIVTTLKNQMKAGRIGHAYLFCGTRGTGKTTVAKILAKAVNCEHPVDGSPCNACPSCQAIQAGRSTNVIEIDAASNNGVDNIREIREEVSYRPTQGRYKVYIIDEVHMLSTGAFNALLKTLEEPPEYVIFILATTEANKIPVTILSRCQRYDFRRITIDTISARLKDLMEREGVEAEEKALRYVARKADGSMRDALSLLDQCIAFYMGETLTYDKVLDVLGTVDTEEFSRLLRNIMASNVAGSIRQLEKRVKAGERVLDVGTGSGILGIAALKLGAGSVRGTDLDENAIAAVGENLVSNGIAPEQFEVIRGNIIDDKQIQDWAGYEAYDIVTANILADVIIPLVDVIPAHLKEGGYFITSGIINMKEEAVKAAFAANSAFAVEEITYQGEWVSITARKLPRSGR